MISVRNLIEELKEMNIELVAGNDNIDNKIEHLNVQEVLEKSERIKSNALIMTTFNAFKNIDHILDQLNWYISKNVIAVGFHTAVYKKIPQEVIDYSNLNHLPLLSIPSEIPYHLMFEKFNYLVQKETSRLKKNADELNECLLEAVLQEKEMDYIIHLIGTSLDKPVLFLDESLKISSMWSNITNTRQDIYNLMIKLKEEHFNLFLDTRLKQGQSQAIINSKTCRVTIMSINRGINFFGFLVLLYSEDNDVYQQLVLKYSTTALKLHQAKINAVKQYEKNKDIEIFEAIFRNKVKESINVQDFFYKVARIKYLFVAQPRIGNDLEKGFQELNQLFSNIDRNTFMWIYDKKIIGLIQKKINLSQLQQSINSLDNIQLGMSGEMNRFSNINLRKLFQEAVISLDESNKCGKHIITWDSMGLEKVIRYLSTNELFYDYDLEILRPLIESEQQNTGDLIHTLYIYLRNFFSLKETGDELFIHPNTVKYRILKVQDVLNIDFTQPEQYMKLMIALQVYYNKKELSVN